MDILYISAFPKNYYLQLSLINPTAVSPAAQKYNSLLVQGLKQDDVHVQVLCTNQPLAAAQREQNKEEFSMVEGGIPYQFPPFRSNPSLNRKAVRSFLHAYIKQYQETHPKAYYLIDYLAPHAETICRSLLRYTVIVTDLPEMIYTAGPSLRKTYYQSRGWRMLNKASSAIVLSPFMMECFRNPQKSHLVLEGIVEEKPVIKTREKKKIVLYGGAISYECGIDRLVQAFSNLHTDWQLYLYGTGNYAQRLENILQGNQLIHYKGMISQEKMLEKEQEASLLVNPRPAHTSFSKYSYPSKNMEYMASGTPLITTELDSMPADHKKYVILFQNDTVEGIQQGLKNVLSKTPEELAIIGQEAQKFVYTQKNKKKQARKVLDFLIENDK
jgi:glycosyltransferase involved in cell wall biosynthesis